MRKTLGMLLLLLSGCSTMGGQDGDIRHLGVIDQKSTASRSGNPSRLLMAFGAIGGAIYGSMADSSHPTNMYSVKTVEGESVTAFSDDVFAIGECVEVVPSRGVARSPGYYHGDARILRSEKCSTPAGSLNRADTANRESM